MWETVKIDSLGKVVTGKTPSTKQPAYYGGDYPFITPTDMADDARIVSTERTLSDKGYAKQKNSMLPADSICFVCIGATIGKICMTQSPSFSNQQINSIVPTEKKHNKFFIYYLMRTQSERVKSVAGGAATPIVNKTTFSNLEVSVPKLEIQNKIASILSAYDDLIENNLKRIKILEEMAQMIYREWFVNFRFPGHEKVKMVDSPLGKIPEGWEVVKVKGIIKRLKAEDTYTQDDVNPTGNVLVIDQSRDEFLGFHDDKPAHIASPDNPIVIFGDHTCKMQLMVQPFSLGPNVVPFIAKEDVPIIYIYYLVHNIVKTREYKRHWTELSNKNVVYCSSSVGSMFADNVRPFLEQTNALRIINMILRKTRDLLLPKLISGEMDVEGLDIKCEEVCCG